MAAINVICYKYKPLNNRELPLKIRICKDRKTRYINLGISIKAEEWDFDKNALKAGCPNSEYLEKLISNQICQIRGKIVELKSEDKEYSATTLVEKIAHPTRFISVGELFKQHLDIPFSEMDYNWLKRYETWLRKQNKSETTIGIRFRNIRMIFNFAVDRELVKPDYYPFKKFKVSKLHQQTAKRALTKEEIRCNKLINMRNKLAHELDLINFKDVDIIENLSSKHVKENVFDWLDGLDISLMDDTSIAIFSNLVYMNKIITQLNKHQ